MGAPVLPILYFTPSNLSISLPHLKPKGPINFKLAFVPSIDTAKILLFNINSWVKFFLLIATAIFGGSAVT